MATVHLHPAACNKRDVISIQRRTGLIATMHGELITHDEHQRRINGARGLADRIISKRIRDAVKRHLRGAAEARCRYPDPEADVQPCRSHRQDMADILRDDDPGPGPSAA